MEEGATKVLQLIKDAFWKVVADLAKELGGYDILTMLLGKDPITDEPVNANTADIIKAIMELPIIKAIGGDKLYAKIVELNLVEKSAAWLTEQWNLLKSAFVGIKDDLLKIWEDFSFESLANPMGLVRDVVSAVTTFVDKIIQFFKNLADQVLEIIKQAMVFILKNFMSEQSYGYDLAVLVYGEDPVTGEPVEATPQNIICAFLKLLPDGEALCEQFIESGAIERAAQWIMNAIAEFIQIIASIGTAFLELWETSSIEDLFEPIAFFQRIYNLFVEPITQLLAFIKRVLLKIIEIVLDIMNFPVDIIQQIINNAMQAFEDIKKDPIQFFLNLLEAVKLGFTQFFKNIWKHLLDGVTGWLFWYIRRCGYRNSYRNHSWFYIKYDPTDLRYY